MTEDTNTVIQIKALQRHYRMGDHVIRALDGVDFKLKRGDFVMIVGSSGSGKSTLMHLLGLLDTPTGGNFEIENDDVTLADDEKLSKLRNEHIGFIFQQFNVLHNLTVVENIALPLAYRGVERSNRIALAEEYAMKLGLAERLKHFPKELSGGQLQRVAIARALASQPNIILADEPTGNLDSKTAQEIMDILYDLHAQGHTLIMVTHDMNLALQGTRKVTIKDGKILSDEPGKRKNAAPASVAATPKRTLKVEAEDGMTWQELVLIGIREGLMAHKLRSFLTTLGIVIGVSSVLAMSSFSLGSKKKQADQIRALGANLIRIVDNQLENERLNDARTRGSLGLSLQDLESLEANVEAIEKSAKVREVKMSIIHDHGEASARILGVSGDYTTVNNLTLKEGRYFDPYDHRSNARVTVLGYGVARQLGLDGLIGSRILLGGSPFTIIGIFNDKHIDTKELEASSIADPNNDLLIPLETLQSRTTDPALRSPLDEIQLQLNSEDELYTAGKAIKRVLSATHKGVEDYTMVIPMELLKQKQQSQKLLDVLTAFISSISIIVGGIGIMNIMLASVTERIREIGIRRAIGATKKEVLHQFLSEAVIISVSGGMIGVLVALAIVFATSILFEIPIVLSLAVLFIALAASMVTGLIFGIYPAYQAAQKNPVDALRYE